MSAVISASSPAVDLAAIKNKQHLAWSAGDYAVVGTTLQIVGESICEALDLRAGERVLDVAAGNGNATLAAARRWCDVVSTDYVPTLLERGPRPGERRRPAGEVRAGGRRESAVHRSQFRCGVVHLRRDVHARPGQGGGGNGACLQTRRPDRPRELDAGQFCRRTLQADGQVSAAAGRREVARALGHRSAAARTVRRAARLDRDRDAGTSCSATTARPIGWRSFAPSTARCTRRSGRSTPTQQAALSADLIALAEKFNRATDGTLVAPSEYIEVVIKRK